MAKEKEKETPEKQANTKNKLLLFGVPLLIVFIFAAAAGAYFLGVFNGGSSNAAASAGKQPGKDEPLGPLLKMEDLVVNITHKDSTRFLKVGITLEVADEQGSDAIKRRLPQITDAVLLLVGNKSFDEIKDLQGKMQLKADLLARIQELSGSGNVKNLFFTDFVVQ